MNKTIAGIVVVVVVALAAFFFLGSQPTGQASGFSELPVKEITVSVDSSYEFWFDNKQLDVSKGDSVKVTFRNTGSVIHNWVIPQFGAATQTIQPGQVSSVEFVADESGTFEYLCTVPGHKERGMFGSLVVS